MLPPAKLPIKPAPARGEALGKGAYKTAYLYPDDPTKVILRSVRGAGRSYDSEWSNEVKMLHQLDQWGFPVLQVHDFFIGDDDHTHMIVDRHNAGRGDNKVGACYNAKCTVMYNRINENSVKSIRQIVRATNKAWVSEIGDFQYLWADDGRIIINDPHIYIKRCDNQEQWDRDYKGKDLWYTHLRGFVERVNAEKTGVIKGPAVITDAHCDDIYANAVTWWQTSGKKTVAKTMVAQKAMEELEAQSMAVMGIPTIKHRWVEIGHTA